HLRAGGDQRLVDVAAGAVQHAGGERVEVALVGVRRVGVDRQWLHLTGAVTAAVPSAAGAGGQDQCGAGQRGRRGGQSSGSHQDLFLVVWVGGVSSCRSTSNRRVTVKPVRRYRCPAGESSPVHRNQALCAPSARIAVRVWCSRILPSPVPRRDSSTPNGPNRSRRPR